ncbi:MAG: thioredoxin TrxC [Magnetococcales bacterium]|nr:thioredoxin TrxC [Magnetococcales bacterium]
MSDSCIGACIYCSQLNRINTRQPYKKAICGKCKKALFVGQPINLNSQNFLIHLKAEIPLVVDFWADWCGPCKMMAPIFKQAAKELEPSIRLGKVDTEAQKMLASQHQILSIPTLILFRGGKEIARKSGAMQLSPLLNWVKSHF